MNARPLLDITDFDEEDLRCAGLRRVDDEWSVRSIEREIGGAEKALNKQPIAGPQTPSTPPAAKPRRVRRPSLESQVRQLLKAGQAAGVTLAFTIEGDRVTATPTRPAAPAFREERGEQPQDATTGRSLFTARAVPKQRIVL
jgi:hypothetical protein